MYFLIHSTEDNTLPQSASFHNPYNLLFTNFFITYAIYQPSQISQLAKN
jgi:hypothetical protein